MVVSILAHIFGYFSQSNELTSDTELEKIFSLDYHQPTLNWDQAKQPAGRMLERYDMEKISSAYQNAWYFLNESLRNNSTIGLEDFFAPNLVAEIKSMLANTNNYIEDRVDLNHNIDLHLYSIDKQVVAFKDSNIRIKRKVLKGKNLQYEEEIFKSYEVVMSLMDGKWKILQMKEIENPKIEKLVKNAPTFVMDSIVTFVNHNVSDQNSSISEVNCNAKAKEGYHKLKKGETLFRLSKKYGVTVKQLMMWNEIKDISDIDICSHIRVKPIEKKRKKIVLVTPRVKRGQTERNIIAKNGQSIFDIAKATEIDASLIKKHNKLETYDIEEGQVIKIPDPLEIQKSKLDNIRGVNYYPQETPWWDFWVQFDSKILRRDLLHIKTLQMNTLRVFVPSDGVIPGLQFEVLLDKLEKFMDECHEQNLQVMVTLFDFPVSFDLSYYTKSERQLESLMKRFKDHPALLGWDLKNEPDLDFEIHGKKKVLQWLDYLIERAREYDPHHILTIGWSNPEAAVNLADKLDLISYHYYRDPKSLRLDMLKLKRKVNNKPLLLQEFGLPSNQKWYNPLGNSEEDQAAYLKDFKKEMEDSELPYLLWTLYDFTSIPTKVFGYNKWASSKQKFFGLIDKNGQKKPAYYIFAPTLSK